MVVGISAILAISGCVREPAPMWQPIAITEQPCPSWAVDPADRHSNADSATLGCVSALNLRAMVEDQADLERGRKLGPASGERETRAVEAYQQGKVAPLAGSSSGASPQVVMPVVSAGSGAPP
jgi:type IV pilus biogenesis protein CpaD/CtpE